MRSLAVAGFFAVTGSAVLLLSGCGGDERPDPFARSTPETRESVNKIQEDREATQHDLKDLTKGTDPDNVDFIVYEAARDRLIKRGTRIEAAVVDTLRTSGDWSVRVGCIEVLQCIGTKESVEAIIAVLDDPAPLVAQNANACLQAMTGVTMVTYAGDQSQNISALPPVPQTTSIERDARSQIWAEWHRRNGIALRKAWADWWVENRVKVQIK